MIEYVFFFPEILIQKEYVRKNRYLSMNLIQDDDWQKYYWHV